jgi:hypothetical protein
MHSLQTYIWIITLLVVSGIPLDAQTIQTPFGKNRVQYHDDFDSWWMYETENFVTFWYGKGRNIAKSTMQLAQMDHGGLEKILAHSMNDKIRIIIYLDHSDYNQTNIAYFDTREAGGAGLAQFYDNKVIVFFNGDHQQLRRQIRAGIVQAYLQSMFNELNLQQIYQNMVSSDLPNWFTAGLVDYLTEKWPASVQQDLSGLFRTEQRLVRKFESFAGEYPLIAGHSMWHYLERKYGGQAISDFLYLVRIHNNIDKAFKYVYNLGEREVYHDWYEHYLKYFESDTLSGPLEAINRIIRQFDYPVTRILLDDEAETLFYVTNQYGRIEVIRRSLHSGRENSLLQYGYKNEHQLMDPHYPLLRIDPVSGELGILYETRDQLRYRALDTETGEYSEVLFPQQVQRIYDFDYEKPGFLVFTGSLDGFTDLFLFDLEKRQTASLTENYFDKRSVRRFRFAPGEFLVSGNPDYSLLGAALYDSFPPLNRFDIFRVDSSFQTETLLTRTPDASERQPLLTERGDLIVLSDVRGLQRPYLWRKGMGDYESAGVLPAVRSILLHDYQPGLYIYVYQPVLGRWAIAGVPDPWTLAVNPDSSQLFVYGKEEIMEDEDKGQSEPEYIEIDESLLFQSPFEDPGNDPGFIVPELPMQDSQTELISPQRSHQLPVFNRSRAVASRLRFNFTELTTRIDNQALFEGLETYDPYNLGYHPPPSGFLAKSTVRDLFEDHVIEGGVRMASDFRGMEYFITYDRLKRKWDWKYGFYRKTNSRYEDIFQTGTGSEKLKNRTHIALAKAKYPFDTYRSIHFSGMLRFDQTIVTATGPESLNVPDHHSQRLILGVEYVFDNTSQKADNLLTGSRYKFFTRFSNRFNVQLYDPFVLDLSEGLMGVVGFDARHYIDVLRHSTLAFRLAGQTSFGSEQNIYYLGAVENWFFSQYDDSYPVPGDISYAFKIQAGNLRGFPYNVRNGSTFTVGSIEFRLPVFSYLIKGHIKNSLIRDFQLTGFFDTGMAWYGLTPFSEKNSANVYVLEAPPAVELRIRQIRDPLIAGVGFGIRTTVFGYFLKLDYGWGIENRQWLSPRVYFSMGYDF